MDASNVMKSAATLPDRSMVIITPARVRLRQLSADNAEKRPKPARSGYVEDILCSTIHVPRDRQGVLASLRPGAHYFYHDGVKENFSPRCRVTLQYGRRYEPWGAEVILQ